MRQTIIDHRHVGLIGAILLGVLAGCTPKDGDEDGSGTADTEVDSTGGSEESTGTTGEDPTTGADTKPAGIAFLRGDKPMGGTTEPPPGDPADLLVDVGSFPQVCADPYGFPDCGPEVFHRYSFVLTPAQQQPGSYAAADIVAETDLQSTEDSPCESNGPFPAEGGGTVEVVSIDASQLVVRLIGTGPDFAGSEGVYTVVRCAG